jgi:hypothetical protein
MLFLVPISNFDVQDAIKRLQPSKLIRLDGMPNIVIKGCTNICVSVLKITFNLCLSQSNFPDLWKQAAIVAFLKKEKLSLLKIIAP